MAAIPYPVLQYAEDTLIVLKAGATQLARLKLLLQQISAMTGLHINYEKSTFVPISIDSAEVDSFTALFGCSVASFPQTYLGLPLIACKIRSCDLQLLVQAIDHYIPG